MRGKHLAIGLLIVMFGAFGIICWIGLSGGSQHIPPSERARSQAGHDAAHAQGPGVSADQPATDLDGAGATVPSLPASAATDAAATTGRPADDDAGRR